MEKTTAIKNRGLQVARILNTIEKVVRISVELEDDLYNKEDIVSANTVALMHELIGEIKDEVRSLA